MSRLVLRLPKGLADKVAAAAEEEDMLPTEYIRELVRESFKSDEESEDEDDEVDAE